MADSFSDIIDLIQSKIEQFQKEVPAVQKSMLNTVLVELKDLDLDSKGNIKTSVSNLKTIGKIKGNLSHLILTDNYLTNVNGFLDSFLAVANLQNQYWQGIESEFTPGKLLDEIKSQAITDTANILTENGIAANISDALQAIMQTSVSSGGSYADLTEQLRTALTDQPGDPGLLSKYSRTYTTDALNTFAAQYNQTISDDLGYEWFAYQGSDIETTRPFCDAMTDFTFFNVEEIPRLLAAENLYYTNKKTGKRELVPIYPKTGLPQGMKAETTPANFQTLRGGWNCGHQIRPVPASAVPTYIKNRDQIPNIQKKAKEGGPELDEIGNKYAKEFDGTITPLNYKSYDSITRKTRDELGGDYTKVTDAVRNTVVVDYNKIDSIAVQLKTDPRFTRVKVQEGPDYFGYKGIITNVRLKNGTIAEMQVNSPGMIYAKVGKKDALNVMTEAEYQKIADLTGLPGGLGHEYYDTIRELKGKISRGEATSADLATYNNTIKKSEEYYSHFYDLKLKEVTLPNETTKTAGPVEGVKTNSEGVQYNGSGAIEARGRAESYKVAAEQLAKEKIANPATNASLKSANSYTKSVGLPKVEPHKTKSSTAEQQKPIADTFLKLQDVNRPGYQETSYEKAIYEGYKAKYPKIISENNITSYKDLVHKAYKQLISEVDRQFESLPVKIDFHNGDKNYLNSSEMLDDVHNFNHLWVYGGGEDHTELGSKTIDANGLTANDKFRAVHDYYGHSVEGYQFGPKGEENAWLEHSKMFSPLAQWALSSETRGQNSVVNYSGINEVVFKKIALGQAMKAKGEIEAGQKLIDEGYRQINFAEQKAIILPEEQTNISKYYTGAPTGIPGQLKLG